MDETLGGESYRITGAFGSVFGLESGRNYQAVSTGTQDWQTTTHGHGIPLYVRFYATEDNLVGEDGTSVPILHHETWELQWS